MSSGSSQAASVSTSCRDSALPPPNTRTDGDPRSKSSTHTTQKSSYFQVQGTSLCAVLANVLGRYINADDYVNAQPSARESSKSNAFNMSIANIKSCAQSFGCVCSSLDTDKFCWADVENNFLGLERYRDRIADFIVFDDHTQAWKAFRRIKLSVSHIALNPNGPRDEWVELDGELQLQTVHKTCTSIRDLNKAVPGTCGPLLILHPGVGGGAATDDEYTQCVLRKLAELSMMADMASPGDSGTLLENISIQANIVDMWAVSDTSRNLADWLSSMSKYVNRKNIAAKNTQVANECGHIAAAAVVRMLQAFTTSNTSNCSAFFDSTHTAKVNWASNNRSLGICTKTIVDLDALQIKRLIEREFKEDSPIQ